MLNETYELNQSMQAAGIAPPSWHKDYGTCPKNKTYRLLLTKDGAVGDLEPIADLERIKSLRKWEVSNGTSFPAFNVVPLLHATNEKGKDNTDALRKLLKSSSGIDEDSINKKIVDLEKNCEWLWTKSEVERINRCLKSHSKALAEILGDAPLEFKAVKELIRRAAMLDADKLEGSIKQVVIHHLIQSPGDAKDWVDSLLVTSSRGVRKVSLVLELADWSLFKYPANHEKAQEWINACLMSHNIPSVMNNMESNRDAFGLPLNEADLEEKFPDAELKQVLGKVTLRAMSSESPCQTRYKRADAKSFPCSKDIRQGMKNSLEWLGDPVRKGKTWQNVSESCGYDKGLLFAYPSALADDPPELAELFVAEEMGDREGAKFEATAARVTPALEGIVKEHPDTEIRVFVLAKPDGYRTKVLVSENYSARRIIAAAKAWQEGCRNIPPISLNMGTGDKPLWIAPLIPFPSEVVRCLNIAWLQSGIRTKPVHGLEIGDGIGLLVETGQRSRGIVDHALQRTIYNTASLLLAIGQADHTRDGSFGWNRDTAKYAKHPSLLLSLLGLLLYKLNYTKGGYMSSSPFLVGQMLALADTLHKEYCQHVRKGELPPQLIGNALMPTALDNPTAGLARLSERIAPYHGWANTAVGDDVGLAKWTLQRYQHVAGELGKQKLPDQCKDADKAQMLLGYLARIED